MPEAYPIKALMEMYTECASAHLDVWRAGGFVYRTAEFPIAGSSDTSLDASATASPSSAAQSAASSGDGAPFAAPEVLELYNQAIEKLQKVWRLERALPYDEPPAWYFPTSHYLGVVLLQAHRYQVRDKCSNSEYETRATLHSLSCLSSLLSQKHYPFSTGGEGDV